MGPTQRSRCFCPSPGLVLGPQLSRPKPRIALLIRASGQDEEPTSSRHVSVVVDRQGPDDEGIS